MSLTGLRSKRLHSFQKPRNTVYPFFFLYRLNFFEGQSPHPQNQQQSRLSASPLLWHLSVSQKVLRLHLLSGIPISSYLPSPLGNIGDKVIVWKIRTRKLGQFWLKFISEFKYCGNRHRRTWAGRLGAPGQPEVNSMSLSQNNTIIIRKPGRRTIMVCSGLTVKIPSSFENWLLQGHSEGHLKQFTVTGNST